jgi:hypothetical protein
MAENTVEKKEVLKFLKIIGVDTRFTSILLPHIYINNLRFSKFSRKKEELFQKNYPHIKVVRSNIFQKICSRSSKILGDVLQPREKVLIKTPSDPWEMILPIILEPYTRKYGIEIIEKEFSLEQIHQLSDVDFDVIALPLTLDHEVEHILGQIFSGEKIGLKSSETKINSKNISKKDIKLIYPLINVPLEWICYYLKLEEENCKINPDKENIAHYFLLFLETWPPRSGKIF